MRPSQNIMTPVRCRASETAAYSSLRASDWILRCWLIFEMTPPGFDRTPSIASERVNRIFSAEWQCLSCDVMAASKKRPWSLAGNVW